MRTVLVSALVAAVVSAGTTVALNKSLLTRELVDVPSLLGLPLQGARSVAESKGLVLFVADEREY